MNRMEPSKRINKRKVFSDSDSEEYVKPPPAKRSNFSHNTQFIKRVPQRAHGEWRPHHYLNSSLTIPFNRLLKKPIYWPCLIIRGPYTHIFSQLGNSVIQNRPFCNLIRQISLKIHLNSLEFINVNIPNLTQRINKTRRPGVDYVVGIAETMCEKVFRFKDDEGFEVDIYQSGMVECLRDLFEKRQLRVAYDSKQEILERLTALCSSKRIIASLDELKGVRNAFVYHCYNLAIDLIQCISITNTEVDPGRIQIEDLKLPIVYYNEQVHTTSRGLTGSARLKSLSQILLDRNPQRASLWVSIPCEEKKHLLDFVLEYGLIQLLPKNARSFLDDWMVGVRKRMRKRLTDGDLRKTIEAVMSNNNNETMALEDHRVEQYIDKIVENVLNTKKFKVFHGQWRDFTLNLVKTMDGLPFGENPDCEEIVRNVCENMEVSSYQLIYSFFSNSPSERSMMLHVLLQLLRFVVSFLLNTLRHVFHFNRTTLKVCYDGQLDIEMTDFRKYEQESDFVGAQPETRKNEVPLQSPNFNCVSTHPVTSEPIYFNPRIPPPNFPLIPNQSAFMSNSSYPIRPAFPFISNQEVQKHGVIQEKKSFLNKSFISSSQYSSTKKPKMEYIDRNLSSEVTEEELSNARALRTPSLVGSLLDDEEDVPKKWRDAYNLTQEWNRDLEAELKRVKATLDTFT